MCNEYFKGEADFFAGFYGQPPPLEQAKGRRVYLVDFSYKPAPLQLLTDVAERVIVLEHHKSAFDDLMGVQYANNTKTFQLYFDLERSGAGLTWDHLFPGVKRPMIVDYVEDRDLWRFKLPQSKRVNSYLSVLPFEFGAWSTTESESVRSANEWMTAHGSDMGFEIARIQEVANKGWIVQQKIDQYVQEVSKNARKVRFWGHDVPVVNAPQCDISELLHNLAQDVQFAIGWWQREDGLFQYSLRSVGDFDVSKLAKQMGGGGHKNAAGFERAKLLWYLPSGSEPEVWES